METTTVDPDKRTAHREWSVNATTYLHARQQRMSVLRGAAGVVFLVLVVVWIGTFLYVHQSSTVGTTETTPRRTPPPALPTPPPTPSTLRLPLPPVRTSDSTTVKPTAAVEPEAVFSAPFPDVRREWVDFYPGKSRIPKPRKVSCTDILQKVRYHNKPFARGYVKEVWLGELDG